MPTAWRSSYAIPYSIQSSRAVMSAAIRRQETAKRSVMRSTTCPAPGSWRLAMSGLLDVVEKTKPQSCSRVGNRPVLEAQLLGDPRRRCRGGTTVASLPPALRYAETLARGTRPRPRRVRSGCPTLNCRDEPASRHRAGAACGGRPHCSPGDRPPYRNSANRLDAAELLLSTESVRVSSMRH